MGYRNIFIENNCSLAVRKSSLIIKNTEDTSIPLEDINCIIIDNRMCNLTTCLLDEISKNDILLYICNEKHLPTTILLNTNSYCRQLKRLQEQLEISKPLKKQLWQKIIVQKVKNQAKCLQELKITNYEILENLSLKVLSGDATNIEAVAAAMYFKMLYGSRFTRKADSIINDALNYGYAIVRGMIARSLVSYGFETSLGLFHHNELNNFNLADDIIECFRPLVDLYITTTIPKEACELTSEVKKIILNVTNQLVLIDGKKYNIQTAIEYVVMSLSKTYKCGENCLVLPQLMSLKEYTFI